MDALHEILTRQRAAFAAHTPDYDDRIRSLNALRDAVVAYETRLAAAIAEDFGGRSADETRTLELVPLLDGIRHTRRALKSWMKPERVSPTWFLRPSKAYIVSQPLGVVGVIGAWNYPLLLTLGPLADALAAGNHAMLKPPELVPRTANVVAEMIASAFDPSMVAVVNGGADVGAAFSALPFDHLVFTGSTRVGGLVMRAASANLTPVTLELGGKSPTIVHESFPLERALRRILVGKLYNAGQTCIAPDYLLVPRGCEQNVESLATRIVGELYPRLVAGGAYTHIVSDGHYVRLRNAVMEVRARGARVVEINPANESCSASNRVFAPTLVFGAGEDTVLMRDEIFGPVLPVVSYDSLDDAIAYVNARPRPLALYYFDEDRGRVKSVVERTTSGGVTINDVLYHIAQHNLPFGGVGPSGMGHYHGRAGFRTFSKRKGVMVQRRWAATSVLAPPITTKTRALIARLLAFSAR